MSMPSSMLRGIFAAAILLATPVPASSTLLIVDSTLDAVDASLGDGSCDDGTGACTLRAGIQEANALSGDDQINLPTGTHVLSIPGSAEDFPATGDLDIRGNLVVQGAGAATTVIDGGALDRIFDFPGTGVGTGLITAEISGVTIQNGAPSGVNPHGNGGGLSLTHAWSTNPLSVTVREVVLTGNAAQANTNGCAIYTKSAFNALTIVDSTIENRDCPTVWGTVHNRGPLTVRGSTIQMNISLYGGGVELIRAVPRRSSTR